MSAARLVVAEVAVSRGGRRILEGVDLVLSHGEVALILGRSGAGKSTLLQVIAGALTPDAGSVRVDGEPLSPVPGRAFPSVGYVMQRPERQFFADTVAAEVAFALERLGIPEAEVRARVEDELSALGRLDGQQSIATLSRGRARLAALASVTVFRPRVLLLDEPTSGLDRAGHAAVIARARQAASAGAAVVIAGHDLAGLAPVVDSIHVLTGGGLVAADPGSDLGRGHLEDAGFELPARWRFFASRLPDFWRAARWRESTDQLVGRLPLSPERPGGGSDGARRPGSVG